MTKKYCFHFLFNQFSFWAYSRLFRVSKKIIWSELELNFTSLMPFLLPNQQCKGTKEMAKWPRTITQIVLFSGKTSWTTGAPRFFKTFLSRHDVYPQQPSESARVGLVLFGPKTGEAETVQNSKRTLRCFMSEQKLLTFSCLMFSLIETFLKSRVEVVPIQNVFVGLLCVLLLKLPL